MSENIVTKMCTKCNIEKPLTEFYKNRTRPDRCSDWCKLCTSNAARVYHKSPQGKAVQKKAGKRFKQSEKGKAYLKRYQQTAKCKNYQNLYWQSEAGKEAQERYQKTSKRKAASKRYKQSAKGKTTEKRRRQTEKAKRKTRENYRKNRTRILQYQEKHRHKYPNRDKARKKVGNQISAGFMQCASTFLCIHCGK